MWFDRMRARRELARLEAERPSLSSIELAIGGFSAPGKMPWLSYSIPAEMCQRGSKLRAIENSVCSSCYACKGRYRFQNVQDALMRRYSILVHGPCEWAAAVAYLLIHKSSKIDESQRYFRWHDSGDIQGDWHLEAMIWIAEQVPQVRFWLPTRERSKARKRLEEIKLQENLTVRVSADMVGDVSAECELPTSSVGSGVGISCPARTQGNKCGDCRACWDVDSNIDYPLH
jgi:hypothetical protein